MFYIEYCSQTMNKCFTIDYLIGNHNDGCHKTDKLDDDDKLIDRDNNHTISIVNERNIFNINELNKYHIGLRNVNIKLEGSSLWNKFHSYNTEMIVTKNGRFVCFF